MQSKAKKMNLEKEYMSKEEVCTFLGITILHYLPSFNVGILLQLNPILQRENFYF